MISKRALYTTILSIGLVLVYAANNSFAKAPESAPSLFSESAEDIILRAHHGDTKAMLFAVAGYSMGYGNFPLERDLARAWGGQLFYHGDLNAMNMAVLLLASQEVVTDASLGTRLSQCKETRGSALAKKYAQSGIFDVERFCGELNVRKKSVSGWEIIYKEAQDNFSEMKKVTRTAIQLSRKMREQSLSPEEAKQIVHLSGTIPVSSLVFYASTTHDPESSLPNWSLERATAFLATCRTAFRKDEKTQFWLRLAQETERYIYNKLNADSGVAKSLILKAHNADIFSAAKGADDAKAVRKMASHYRNGTLGFPEDSALWEAWVTRAAMENDTESMLVLALLSYINGDFPIAWAWAETIKMQDNTTESVKNAALNLVGKIETMGDKTTLQQGTAWGLSFFEERSERLKRRKAAEK